MPDQFRIAAQTYNEAIRCADIKEHPENYNEGDVGAICASLDKHGFYGAVLVQKSTGFVIAGNHRLRAAMLTGAQTIPGFILDVDDDEARRIMADDNKSARLSVFNEHKLVEMLTGLAGTPGGLPATYDGDDLDALIAQLGRPYVPDDPGSDGGYAEDPDAQAAREGKIGGYNDRKDGGALVEMILVFAVDARAEVGELLDRLRAAASEPDARAADLILQALRVYAAAVTHQENAVVAEIVAGARRAD